MDIDAVVRRLPHYLNAGIPVEITGASGIGKSDAVGLARENMEKMYAHPVGLGSHFVATYTPPDVTGYLAMHMRDVINERGEVTPTAVSEFSQPPWMLDDYGMPLNGFKRGICALEEYDKALGEVKKAFGPVILYRRIATWGFHSGIGIVILSNDASSNRQGSTKDFDFLINRKVIITATASVQGFLRWAARKRINPLMVAFAEGHVATVFSGTVPEQQGPFCTPRSIVALAALLDQVMDGEGNITDMDFLIESAHGCIGGPATNDLGKWLAFKDKVPTWAEIVKDPSKAKVPEDASGQLMVAHQCSFNVDMKTAEQAVRYVRRLRKEFYITFAKSAASRDFRLVNSKPFEAWTDEEPQLVALLNALGGAK